MTEENGQPTINLSNRNGNMLNTAKHPALFPLFESQF